MDETKTKWEQLQTRFRNSLPGIIILSLIALGGLVTQVGAALKWISDWVRPEARADLILQQMPVEPLEQYQNVPRIDGAGNEAIYPVGAVVKFELRHNLQSSEEVRVNSLDVEVEAYDPRANCPFELTGDEFRGAGQSELRTFMVVLASGKVEGVQRREDQKPVMRGRSTNLLNLDPPVVLTLRKQQAESVETIRVKFLAADAARYKVGLSIGYSSQQGLRTQKIAPVAICKP